MKTKKRKLTLLELSHYVEYGVMLEIEAEENKKLVGVTINEDLGNCAIVGTDNLIDIDFCKPILRSLKSIRSRDMFFMFVENWNIYFLRNNRILTPEIIINIESGSIELSYIDESRGEHFQTVELHLSWDQGFLEISGDEFFDKDTIERWLLEKQYDIFNLINDGLAVELQE